jgi:hypothetical protein
MKSNLKLHGIYRQAKVVICYGVPVYGIGKYYVIDDGDIEVWETDNRKVMLPITPSNYGDMTNYRTDYAIDDGASWQNYDVIKTLATGKLSPY